MDLGRRFGTERDKLSLQQTMKNLGFDVTAHDDLTYHEVAKEVEKCMYFMLRIFFLKMLVILPYLFLFDYFIYKRLIKI